jgi:hypothetical protein
MNPIWLFEADVFGQTAEPFKAEVRRQGMACHVTRQDLLARGHGDSFGGKRLAADECLLAFGCFPFLQHIQMHRKGWIPAGWCNLDTLACGTYYHHFMDYLLNQRHRILTAVEAVASLATIYSVFGKNDQVFVRPNGCQKTFTGRLADRESFADAVAPARYDPATLIVVAEPKPITREWRLVVAERQVIAASQYLEHGVIQVSKGCPQEVWSFASEMLARVTWQPDEIFMMDICESAHHLYLLELNSFSCSALYECDFQKVVTKASHLAVRAWTNRKTRP